MTRPILGPNHTESDACRCRCRRRRDARHMLCRLNVTQAREMRGLSTCIYNKGLDVPVQRHDHMRKVAESMIRAVALSLFSQSYGPISPESSPHIVSAHQILSTELKPNSMGEWSLFCISLRYSSPSSASPPPSRIGRGEFRV